MSITALIIDDEQLARDELQYLLDDAGDVEVLAQGRNGIEAVELIETHHPDLVFLDVQMPGLDGFAVLKQLLEHGRSELKSRGVKTGDGKAGRTQAAPYPMPQIIFATAFDQYAVRAFDVNAIDYLLKPFDRARVLQALTRARARLHENGTHENGVGETNLQAEDDGGRVEAPGPGTTSESRIEALLRLMEQQAAAPRPQSGKIVLLAGSRLLLADQKDICFAAIDDGVISVVTPTLEGQSKCRTLEELLDLLDPAVFWRAHRSYVVNINHIKEVVPWFKSSYQLRMADRKQTEIPVSRAQTRRLRELFKL